MKNGFLEAIEMLEDWGSYVDEYFKDKHNFNGDIEILKKYADEFESRKCPSCYYDNCGCSVQDTIWRMADLDDAPLPDFEDFGCNKWEQKK